MNANYDGNHANQPPMYTSRGYGPTQIRTVSRPRPFSTFRIDDSVIDMTADEILMDLGDVVSCCRGVNNLNSDSTWCSLNLALCRDPNVDCGKGSLSTASAIYEQFLL